MDTSSRIRPFSLLVTGLFFLVALVAQDASAFSKERCGNMFPMADGDHPYYYSPIYISTMIPSTTSYFSSIGPCSMYGEYQSSSRISFIEDELPSIRIDASRGDGEYVRTLAALSGCTPAAQARVGAVLKREFATVFAVDSKSVLNQSGESQIDRIDSALRTDSELRQSCAILN